MKLGSKTIVLYVAVPLLAVLIAALVLPMIVQHRTSSLAASLPANDALPELRVIPKELLQYAQTGRIAVDLKRPVALAVGPEDRVYVTGSGGIRVYDPVPVMKIETSAVGTCIAVADDGRIYAGFTDHVEVYDALGKRLATWASVPGRPYLTSIALSGQDVYLADSGNRIVWHCDMEGNVIGRIGGKDESRGVPGFVVPSPYFDVAIGHDGLLRVSDPGRHRIEAYTTAGDLEFFWGELGNAPAEFCGCCNPVNFCLLKDGRVVTAEKGLPTVKVFEPDGDAHTRGRLQAVVAGPEQLADANGRNAANAEDQVCDVAVDSRGRVLVLDPFTSSVRIFVSAREPVNVH